MKLPVLFRKRKKLEATARRAVPAAARDFEEPSIKLSSAVIVVLILHIVAVSGIYAFSSIKAHRGAASFESAEKKEAVEVASKPAVTAPVATAKMQRTSAAVPERSADAPSKKPAATQSKSTLKDSGETYLVLKGDKLATIAKKLHVHSEDLLKLNKIDDPKKLQIGQKLRVPAKRPASDS